ncbi:hypothetical protein JMN23_05160 [Bacillus sp. RHFB]|nr:hypothetical protein [Bacillus sp. RHFB]
MCLGETWTLFLVFGDLLVSLACLLVSLSVLLVSLACLLVNLRFTHD